jgi:glutathione S-transferase
MMRNFVRRTVEMIKIWGRTNSVNVQKVLWCCHELGLEYQRIDAGMQFGVNREPEYLAMNPNGGVPTLLDGDLVLWESNSIMRYLALQYGKREALYPAVPAVRAHVERWLDWSLSTLQPAEMPVFWGLVRTPEVQRDMPLIKASAVKVGGLWKILDTHLAGRTFVEAEQFTLADIVLGAYARRWFGVEGIERPSLPNLEGWYRRVGEREGFQRYVAPALT